MQKELVDYKEQLEAAKNEVKVQQGKNDDLRTKNWKAMEALSNMERLYQKNAKSNNSKKPPGQTKANSSGFNQNAGNQKKNKTGRNNKNQTDAEQTTKTF